MSLDHLLGEVEEIVGKTPEERIEFIRQDRWIGYGAAREVLDNFSDLIRHPKVERMPCRALIAEPNNGKTMILRQCDNEHPVDINGDDEYLLATIRFDTPTQPKEGKLYSAILDAVVTPHRRDASPEKLYGMVVDRIRALRIRTLFADEFHNMLVGSPKDQRAFLVVLKRLINDTKVCLVAAGTQGVKRALATDPQFSTRFEQFVLPAWGKDKTTRQFLASYERVLPFEEPSFLHEKELFLEIEKGGLSTVGNITNILKKSAIFATKADARKIEAEHIREAIKQKNAREILV